MPQAIVDPDELDRFTRELDQFNTRIEQMNKELRFRFNRVSETWKDEQNKRFAEDLVATSKNLDRFVESSRRQVPRLRKQAELARAYLKQR